MSKEYKQLSCRDVGADCDFQVRAETEDELMRICYDHGCHVHGKCEVSAEEERMIKSHIQTVSV
ncbi:MAG: DUF1059 domain-containing protein [Deltaproteobacteria bacterium]|nr:DUF1059 domain-containing protein [Deltaproteobacteria bacterium]